MRRKISSNTLYSVLFCWLVFTQSHQVYSQEIKPWPWQNSVNSDLTILLFGDLNIQNQQNPLDPFRYILPTMQNADVRIANLEGPFAGTSKDPLIPDIPHKTGWKHSEPEMVKGLVGAHIDLVGVANNVTFPWTALTKSLRVLDEQGIYHAGGGSNIKEAHMPVILEKKGVRVGFLAYSCLVFPFQHAATVSTPGIASVRINTLYQPPNKYDKPGTPPIVVTIPVQDELDRMTNDIRTLRQKVDILICSYHWGRSHYVELIDYQVTLAHAAIDAGADVVMGHGNHELGAIEVWKNCPIFYGLANFVFDWPKMKTRKNGLMAKLSVKGRSLRRVSAVPMQRDSANTPVLLDPTVGKGAALFSDIKERSDGLSELYVNGKEIVVIECYK